MSEQAEEEKTDLGAVSRQPSSTSMDESHVQMLQNSVIQPPDQNDVPDNYKKLSMFSCVACGYCCNCCCGIAAVYQSKECDKAYKDGDYEQAGINSRQAKKFSIITIICGSAFVVITIITIILWHIEAYRW